MFICFLFEASTVLFTKTTSGLTGDIFSITNFQQVPADSKISLLFKATNDVLRKLKNYISYND